MAEDFAVLHRDELELTCDHNGVGWEGGPYASLAAALLAENAAKIRRLLVRYGRLPA